jgi:hypothetical protein
MAEAIQRRANRLTTGTSTAGSQGSTPAGALTKPQR